MQKLRRKQNEAQENLPGRSDRWDDALGSGWYRLEGPAGQVRALRVPGGLAFSEFRMAHEPALGSRSPVAGWTCVGAASLA